MKNLILIIFMLMMGNAQGSLQNSLNDFSGAEPTKESFFDKLGAVRSELEFFERNLQLGRPREIQIYRRTKNEFNRIFAALEKIGEHQALKYGDPGKENFEFILADAKGQGLFLRGKRLLNGLFSLRRKLFSIKTLIPLPMSGWIFDYRSGVKALEYRFDPDAAELKQVLIERLDKQIGLILDSFFDFNADLAGLVRLKIEEEGRESSQSMQELHKALNFQDRVKLAKTEKQIDLEKKVFVHLERALKAL